MVQARTVVDFLLGGMGVAGSAYVAMGLGLIDMPEDVIAVASPFLDPLQIPPQPFFLVLGTGKILGVLKLCLGMGPLPEWFAKAGLLTAAACGAYGHVVNGETPIPAIVMMGLLVLRDFLPDTTKDGKKE
mmetsp:Transcript_18999/g.28676  ORF Transcript_18999/g.28676 Transcript_18999/m.28676 type:complete len:130 (+) Transcript_18999:126-515(+)|eukprot:CAMPEP_0178907346 /NCGR_PEP_ID=MMETSP0786-20121207/7322_1 /TAXON_ID=186022 /ORGANISM="Thalassionema frauenfeldii, Strain CCMP 1798" /LENGTH=129 /DNA_ID=CAMNT_0020579139 /DNA_START=36 /DNA_END=425 /DNA_ORIENTATION=+